MRRIGRGVPSSIFGFVSVFAVVSVTAGEPSQQRLSEAVGRSLKLLESASAGSAGQRKCFTCHSQAMPVFALTAARELGLEVDDENYRQQIRHTFNHLRRGKKSYLEGKGQGGGVDTAGYALWTLEEGGHVSDETTDVVTDWLFEKQADQGHWKCSSNRPPSEESDFATTYLALRAIGYFAPNSPRLTAASEKAASWLRKAEARSTEDRVFQLLALGEIDPGSEELFPLIESLASRQNSDGGWSQLESMESDAYATATVLYGFDRLGMKRSQSEWSRGIEYLLSTQEQDGSWQVQSRSDPFQKYYESGFPHGKDQFISTTATAWATIVLLSVLAEHDGGLEAIAPEEAAPVLEAGLELESAK